MQVPLQAPSLPALKAPLDAETRLKRALHENNHAELVRLYTEASDKAERNLNIDEACFLLTQGSIVSLQHDLPTASALQLRLSEHGRL